MRFLLHILLICLIRSAYTLYECDYDWCGCCKNRSCRNSLYGPYCSEGCVDGYYGSQCRHACPANCQSCNNSFSCNLCAKGFWGLTCQRQCWRGCNSCDKATSNCNFDCKDNFVGHNCYYCPINCEICTSATDCVCKQRFWGEKCQLHCPPKCTNCYSTNLCSACDSGYYGDTCNVDCRRNCKDRICNLTNGICLSCTAGYYGDYCVDKCPERCINNTCKSDGRCFACVKGYYGQQCTERCPTNCDGGCDMLNGVCKTCIRGYFGNNCTSNCPINCSACRSETYCWSCKVGYKGQSCHYECSNCKTETACGQWDGYCKECSAGLSGVQCTQSCFFPCKSCPVYNGRQCTKCLDGTYGKNDWEEYPHCSRNCSSNCLNKTCDTITGQCNYGCANGFWGKMCNNRCSENCKDQVCSRNNGSCTEGCKEGYALPQCTCPLNCDCNINGICYRCKDFFKNIDRHCTCRKELCSNLTCTSCSDPKFYPENSACCPCSKSCKKNMCESKSKCSFGCAEGYRGNGCSGLCTDVDLKCSECTADYTLDSGKCLKCMTGYYPEQMSKNCSFCSDGCVNEMCNDTNGECISGCKEGRWGINCERHCSNNCQICDQTNGTCEVCKAGKYMSDCSMSCSENCNVSYGLRVCRKEDGACLNGCNTPGKYGMHCENICNSTCVNNTCDWETGSCLNGCVFNHYGKQCQNECNAKCNEVEGVSPCDPATGYCVTGCTDGYFGNYCDKTCSSNCVNNTCQRIDGTCIFGCTNVFGGADCMHKALKETERDNKSGLMIGLSVGAVVLVIIIAAVVVAFLLIKRRNNNGKAESNNLNETNLNNAAVTYSELRAREIELDENNAVYAKPNKPKRKITKDSGIAYKSNNGQHSMKSHHQVNKTENGKWKTVNPYINENINYTDHQDNKPCDDVTSYGNDTIRLNCKTPPLATEPIAVHKNNKAREPVMKTSEATYALRQRDSSDLEIEEDLANITAIASDMFQKGYRTTETEGDYAYYNVAEVRKRKVPLEKLAEYVSKKKNEDFLEEFDKLPEGLIKPYTESQKKENLTKNRYKGLYPYDQKRVILKGGDSDYINASFVDGYRKIKAYVASIGPTYKYMEDLSPFWRMVWQEKVGKIVMLTKLSEAGVTKCDKYWPEKKCSVLFADICVTTEREEIYADYTVRSFAVQKDSKARNIVQVHFTAWPDKGIPDDVTSLIEFRQKVNNSSTDLDGPVLVHCSAGIGRTGTYIAIDSLIQEGEVEGGVDIYACVRNLREQRVNMVQTAEQYRYLHNAVMHRLAFDSKPIKTSKFHEYMSTHKSQLENQYQQLQASAESRPDAETEAVILNKALKDKNRSGADIPGESNRPKLFLRRQQGISAYINALYINGFRTKNRFLVAQTPLPNTVEDFLTLIVQEKVSCIVTMETNLNGNKTVGTYYHVDSQPLKVGCCTVQSESAESTGQYEHRKLKIMYEGKSRSEEVMVTHIQFTRWGEKKKIPDDPRMFMRFVKDVELKYDSDGNDRPILVHCLTGAEKSGLFCVVSILIEKTQLEQEISVVNTVRQVKNRRHKAIPNKEQYIFCHQCLDEYLHTFDTYSNFCLEK